VLQLGGWPVDELRTEFNRPVRAGIGDAEDAAAGAVAPFQHLDVNTRVVQRTCCGEASRSGSDHDDAWPGHAIERA
jgi:hypothetical protein